MSGDKQHFVHAFRISLVAASAISGLFSTESGAAPITAANGYQFLDNVSANSAGLVAGERQQLGSTCVVLAGNPCAPQNLANSVGTSGTATQGSVGPLNLNFIASDLASNQWALSRLPSAIPDGVWTLSFRNGSDVATTDTPTLSNAVKLDFAKATSITPNGATPTFNWLLPSLSSGSSIDSISINIRDLTDFRGINGVGGNGIATLIYRNGGLDGTTTSFSVLANDSHFLAGNSLQSGRLYSLEIQLQDTRNNLSQGGFPNVLSQSRTFIDFVIESNPGVPAGTPIFLPTIDTSGPVPIHTFSDIPVTAGETIFIDPIVAVGFDYQTDAGDPNFRSVTLPTGIGDNEFRLWLWTGADWSDTGRDLLGGQEHLFGSGGVDRFRITGIETQALVDPFSAGAFTTGVSFVSDGEFNGTMTPLIVDIQVVPEPATLALLGLGLAGIALSRRKHA